MNNKKEEAIKRLDAIIKPKQEHINKLKMICEDGRHPATASFLTIYQSELSEYIELKSCFIEALLESQAPDIKETTECSFDKNMLAGLLIQYQVKELHPQEVSATNEKDFEKLKNIYKIIGAIDIILESFK